MPQKAARWWSLTRCPSHTRSFLPVVESAGRRVAGFTKISNQSTSSHRPSVGSRRREFRQITNKKRQEGFKSSGLLVVSRGMCGHVAGGLVGRRRAPMAALFYLFQTRFIPDQWSRRYSAGSESTVARIETRPRHIILCLLEPENYMWWVLWIMDKHMTSHIQNKLNKKKL